MSKLPEDVARQLVQDLLDAQHDAAGLLKLRGLDAAAVAQWALDGATRRTLAGLCQLSEYRTQVLLSRYRAAAASRLAHMVIDSQHPASDDVKRRACVDLLAVTPSLSLETPVDAPTSDGDWLRSLLYQRADLVGISDSTDKR